MSRRSSAVRIQILSLLTEGSIEDPSGRAVELLRRRLVGAGKQDALSVTLARMEQEGLVARNVGTKRTYGLAITDAGRALLAEYPPKRPAPATSVGEEVLPPGRASTWKPTPQATPAEPAEATENAGPEAEIDYDVLAGVLLQKVVRAARAAEDAPSINQLRRELFGAQQAEKAAKALAAQAEGAAAAAAEGLAEAKGRIFDLEAELAVLKQNNETLHKRLDQAERVRRNGDPIAARISPEEKDSLGQLRRELARVMVQPPTARG
jgi:DNA-binding MarR family transcriptional regulator